MNVNNDSDNERIYILKAVGCGSKERYARRRCSARLSKSKRGKTSYISFSHVVVKWPEMV